MTKATFDLTIIVVSYNTVQLTLKCLRSIQTIQQASSLAIELLVVDNGSTDNSVEKIKNLNIKVLVNKDNRGFAVANNQAIRQAKGTYLLLLNSDTLLGKGVLDRLLSFAQTQPNVGIVAPRLLNSDLTPQASCYHLPTLKSAVDEFFLGKSGAFQKYYPRAKTPTVVDAVVGAAMLITPLCLERVGLLDERYFMYFEDLDYCRRVNQHGLKIYYLPDVHIIHLHGQSGKSLHSGQATKWLVQSSKRYHGRAKYYALTSLILLSRLWQKLTG